MSESIYGPGSSHVRVCLGTRKQPCPSLFRDQEAAMSESIYGPGSSHVRVCLGTGKQPCLMAQPLSHSTVLPPRVPAPCLGFRPTLNPKQTSALR